MNEELKLLDGNQLRKKRFKAKKELDYLLDLSSISKRRAYIRQLKDIIKMCDTIQKEKRIAAIKFFLNIPKEERKGKTWNSFVKEQYDK